MLVTFNWFPSMHIFGKIKTFILRHFLHRPCLVSPVICSSSAVAESAEALYFWWLHWVHAADIQTSQDQKQNPAGLLSSAADWIVPVTGHCPSADAKIKCRNAEGINLTCFKIVFTLHIVVKNFHMYYRLISIWNLVSHIQKVKHHKIPIYKIVLQYTIGYCITSR